MVGKHDVKRCTSAFCLLHASKEFQQTVGMPSCAQHFVEAQHVGFGFVLAAVFKLRQQYYGASQSFNYTGNDVVIEKHVFLDSVVEILGEEIQYQLIGRGASDGVPDLVRHGADHFVFILDVFEQPALQIEEPTGDRTGIHDGAVHNLNLVGPVRTL